MRHGLGWLRDELQGRLVIKRGQSYGNALRVADEGKTVTTDSGGLSPPTGGDLTRYFDAYDDGPGIYKWRHYLPIYERHLAHLRGRAARLLEIGVYSGGSLRMWRDYLGPNAHVTGIDIKPSCKAYESTGSRSQSVTKAIPTSGGGSSPRHHPSTLSSTTAVTTGGIELLTLKAVVGHLRPGATFICEDIFDPANRFAQFVQGLERDLYAARFVPDGWKPTSNRAKPGTTPDRRDSPISARRRRRENVRSCSPAGGRTSRNENGSRCSSLPCWVRDLTGDIRDPQAAMACAYQPTLFTAQSSA